MEIDAKYKNYPGAMQKENERLERLTRDGTKVQALLTVVDNELLRLAGEDVDEDDITKPAPNDDVTEISPNDDLEKAQEKPPGMASTDAWLNKYPIDDPYQKHEVAGAPMSSLKLPPIMKSRQQKPPAHKPPPLEPIIQLQEEYNQPKTAPFPKQIRDRILPVIGPAMQSPVQFHTQAQARAHTHAQAQAEFQAQAQVHARFQAQVQVPHGYNRGRPGTHLVAAPGRGRGAAIGPPPPMYPHIPPVPPTVEALIRDIKHVVDRISVIVAPVLPQHNPNVTFSMLLFHRKPFFRNPPRPAAELSDMEKHVIAKLEVEIVRSRCLTNMKDHQRKDFINLVMWCLTFPFLDLKVIFSLLAAFIDVSERDNGIVKPPGVPTSSIVISALTAPAPVRGRWPC